MKTSHFNLSDRFHEKPLACAPSAAVVTSTPFSLEETEASGKARFRTDAAERRLGAEQLLC